MIKPMIRKDLQDFIGYESSLKDKQPTQVLLNANELPMETKLGNFRHLNRYPEIVPTKLLNLLSNYYTVPEECLLVTRGSDDAIDLLIRLFCRAYQDSIIICPPTFVMYKRLAEIHGAEVNEIPLQTKNFSLNEEAILENISNFTKLIFLCSPNNPTGTVIELETIIDLCKKVYGKAMVIVDEAYIEFSGKQSLCYSVKDIENLVVLRTFSKAHGLAALRCGTVIANPDLITYLKAISLPYAIPTPTSEIIEEVFLHRKNRDENIAEIIEQRSYLFSKLVNSPFVEKIWPSYGNFLLVKVTDTKLIDSRLEKNNVLIRKFINDSYLNNCYRITIGTELENHRLLNCFQKEEA